MSGTFSSLSTAVSALRYNRLAMDVASGNVANAATTGYTRRNVVGQTTGAPARPAVWSRWEGAGDGVEASRVDRIVDPLLDSRARTEHASQSFLDTRAASLVRFETTIGEPGDNGIAAALSAFKAGWHDVANNPGDGAARSQLLARAGTLTAAIAAQGRAVSTEWAYQRTSLDAMASEVNQAAADLGRLNGALASASLSGEDANNLLDQRDQLTLRLAELTGGRARVEPDSTVTFTVEGHTLVSRTSATPLTVAGATQLADSAANPLSIQVGSTAVSLSAGEMGGVQSLLMQDLPAYLTRLDAFTSDLVDQTNALHQQGVDLNGNPGTAFFTGSTAASVTVGLTDPSQVAAAGQGTGRLDATNADLLASADLGASGYRELVTGFGVNVASARRQADNQGLVTGQVDASRESLSGVSVDEEMVALLAAQRGYEGASRVLTTIDSMLDTLINRTGLTR